MVALNNLLGIMLDFTPLDIFSPRIIAFVLPLVYVFVLRAPKKYVFDNSLL
jgi:hypothetical protein